MLSYWERQWVSGSLECDAVLFQMDRVEEYLKGQLHQVVALERGVRARHGDDFGFLHQQVLGSV